MTVRPIFAWYDLWIGIYIDRTKRRVYIFPIPCLGVEIDFLAGYCRICKESIHREDKYSMWKHDLGQEFPKNHWARPQRINPCLQNPQNRPYE